MEKIGDEAASRFISALIKSVQTLCHGYLDFQTGIEIIGHINLSVDKGNSLDYILKEKVCKNAENSTLFISNSFHAEPKSEQEVPGKQPETSSHSGQNSEAADSGETTRVSSAISSISKALTGNRDSRRGSSGAKDSDSSYSHQRTAKRKASEDQSSDMCPRKIPSHHDSSHLSSDSPYRPSSSSPIDSKLGLQDLHTADGDTSEMLLPQTANVTDNSDLDVNLAGSVLEPVENQSGAERDDDSDADLEVTFIKEEYVEGERTACDYENSIGQQYIGGPNDRNSEGMSDPSAYPVAHHSSSASSTYVPSAHDPGAVGQQYPGGISSQPQPGPSSTRGSFRTNSQVHSYITPGSLTAQQMSALRRGMATGYMGVRRSNFHECPRCHSKFISLQQLSQHACNTTKKAQHICSICGKGITRKDDYEDHMNRHRNIRAHACPHCALRFTFKNNLRKHMRTGVCHRNKNPSF